MKDINRKVLLIGIGNIGRADDGLAWALLDKVKKIADLGMTIQYTYQLNIEHAEQVIKFDTVIFVDAFQGETSEGYLWEKCEEKNSYEFTSHALEPAVIKALSKELYNAECDMFVLKIQGYEWELKEGLTKKAKINLENAFSFLKSLTMSNKINYCC